MRPSLTRTVQLICIISNSEFILELSFQLEEILALGEKCELHH